MTERLYYGDAYLRDFEARIVDVSAGGCRVYLDRTAFYPASGGQPFDTGSIGGIRVVDVVDEEERIAHVLEIPFAPGEVQCAVDWPRRFDHMQQHSGQHLLSAVLSSHFGFDTVSFHMGEQSSTIDVTAESIEPAQLQEAERIANQIVCEDREVAVFFADASSADLGLRKASERTGELRIVDIVGVDRSACGGTHVRRTGEIGPILLRKLDKIRGNVRIEFLCGARAVARARADFEALSRIGRTLCAPFDEAPALIESQLERLTTAEKNAAKLAVELAKWRGKELFAATTPTANGTRVAVENVAKGPASDELRALANGFAAEGSAVFFAVIQEPPSVLLCASAQAGLHAGNIVKAAVSANGGRGGGNAQMGQGSVPNREALATVEALIRTQLPA